MKLITTNLPVKEIVTGHLTCGGCAGLNVENLVGGKDLKSCSELGKLETTKACPKFQQDPTQIRDLLSEDFEDGVREIADVMKQMNPRQLKAMAGMFLNEVRTRKSKFFAWQPVIVRFRGTASSNYMSNFMTARVVNADKDTIRLTSDDGKTVLRYENTGDAGPSIYSVANFAPLKEMMIEKGKRVDPSDRATPKRMRPLDHKDVDFELNTDGLNGNMSSIGKVVKSNKVARRAKNDSNLFDLTKIAQQIDGGTANYMVQDEDSGEYQIAANKYTKGVKRRRKGSSEVELGDFE